MKKFCFFLMLMIIPALAWAGEKTVTLAWDASPSAGVAGYKIHYECQPTLTEQWDGTQGNMPSPVDVGNVLTVTLTGFPEHLGCYFAASAYDALEFESGLSNVVYSPGFMPPQPPGNLGGVTTVKNHDVVLTEP